MGKIPFPEQGLLQSEKLDAGLQTYLQLLFSDEFIRQSNTLREFVTLEDAFDADSAPAMAMMKKKMRDVFRSATSVISLSQPDEQRRSQFYEAKERHTSASLYKHMTPSETLGPISHSTRLMTCVEVKHRMSMSMFASRL